MEDLLARESAAEEHVHDLLKRPDQPMGILFAALHEYRTACQAHIFADFDKSASEIESKLWRAHTESKRYFHNALAALRREYTDQPVAIRNLVKIFLQFLKESQTFYRQYIGQLNAAFGGIPELEAAAHTVKGSGSGESSQASLSPELRQKILTSCHQNVVYLGDLDRWRATEKLDKNPDFARAIGFYALACTLFPSSGLGYHQQAVIALDQQHHLRAIYNLYRAIVVEHPHPNAAWNLKRELDRINAAWDRGELIRKGTPNDPEAAKQTLTGWFVRLHSMCFKGEPFRGYSELEREVLGQLSTQLKQHDLGGLLMRMVLTNMAAQFNAAEMFKAQPTQQLQTAFLHFFRINIKTFTTLLHVFYDDLKATRSIATDEEDVEQLASKLSDTARRVLPSLRLYTAWLLPNTHLMEGLSSDDILQGATELFWPIYAKVVDLVAATFPIWDLEELPELTYMLEEDSDTVGFKPLVDDKNNKIWYEAATGNLKPRFSGIGVQHLSRDGEVLQRVRGFLTCGLYLANDDNQAPIKLQATRILHRDAEDVIELPMPTFTKKMTIGTELTSSLQISKAPAVVKPLSYAAAATNGAGRTASDNLTLHGMPSASSGSRDAQLSRMVDDLVDDDDSNAPITPPQQQSANPVIVMRSDVSYAKHPIGTDSFTATTEDYARSTVQKSIGSARTTPTAPIVRTPRDASTDTTRERLQSVSSLWDSPSQQPVPAGTLGSPAQLYSRGHSRVNSASSIRSRTSQGMAIADSWSSIDSGPRAKVGNGVLGGLDYSNTASPLLFGAGDSVWSTSSQPPRRLSRPNNQAG